MRRALFLASLALPALAAAQVISGTVTPIIGSDKLNDKYINVDECASATTTVELQWTVKLVSGAASAGIYRVFATNREHSTDATKPYCPEENTTTTTGDVFASKVGGDVAAAQGVSFKSASFPTAQFVTASGRTCAAEEDRTIFVCVHFYPYTPGTTDPGERTGVATGTLIISTSRPGAPALVSTGAGDRKIYAAWNAPSSGATADRYRLEATPAVPAGKRAAEVQGTSGEVGSLENGTEYTVQVFALSVAGNVGDGSNTLPETPIPVDDFWDRYQLANGQEQGGCGLPGAGALALLGLAALLPRVARRVRAGRRQ